MRNKANWQLARAVRDGESIPSISGGYISLNVIDEDLGSVAPLTWTSPTGAVQVGNAKNFEYVGGQIVYTGPFKALVRFETYQAVVVSGGGSKTIVGTGGLDDVPCEDFSMFGSSANNVEAVAINQCRFEMVSGQTLDAYIEHQEGGSRNLTLKKGVYHAEVIEFIE